MSELPIPEPSSSTSVEVLRNPTPTEGMRRFLSASPILQEEAERVNHEGRWGSDRLLERAAQWVTYPETATDSERGVFTAQRVQTLTNMIDGRIPSNIPGAVVMQEELLPAAKRRGAELLVLEKAQYNSQHADVALVVGSVDDRGQLARVDGVLMAQSVDAPARHPALEHSMPVTNPYRDTYRTSAVFTTPAGIDMSKLDSVDDKTLRELLQQVGSDSKEWKRLASLQHTPVT